jgi:hypothetical protein
VANKQNQNPVRGRNYKVVKLQAFTWSRHTFQLQWMNLDICDTALLCIFIRAVSKDFDVNEELLNLESCHGQQKGGLPICLKISNLPEKKER